MPDGTELLASVPERSGPDADTERNFCAAIDKVSNVFGRQKRATTTADEHRGFTTSVQLNISTLSSGVRIRAKTTN